MDKKIIFTSIFIGLNLLSCNSKKEEYDSEIEIIPVNLNRIESAPMTEIIEKIEIIPLETNDDCLISMYSKVVYYKEIELFVIVDNKNVVFLFTKEGKFVTNSKHAQGLGPQQYWIAVDFLYNPFSKCIEIFNPYGTIHRYDTSFNFIEKISLEQKDIIFQKFMPLSATQYILIPSIFSPSDAVLYFCDFNKKTIEKLASYEKHYISSLTMNYQFFSQFDDQLLFSPNGVDYHFYQISADLSSVEPVLKLDFGSEELSKKRLERMTGFSYKSSNNEKDQVLKINKMNDANQVLLESDLYIPIVKLISAKYVYIHILSNQKRSNYIYNRKTQKGFFQKADDTFKLYFGIQMDENVLIAISQPFEIDEYVKKQYMSQQDIEKMENIREDDNPIIIQYHLK